MKKTLVLIATLSASLAAYSSLSATIPAGTTLTVRTMYAISSHEKVGRTFVAQLDQNVTINGSVALRAGTQFAGKVEASRGRSTTRSSPLTLNLTGVSVSGRIVPVKTTGGFQPEVKAKTAKQSRGGFSVGETTFPPGTKLEFRLAKPLIF